MEYSGGNKLGKETVTETIGVAKPFNIQDMHVSTTEKFRFDSPSQEAQPKTKINIHVKTSEGPMVFRINRTDVDAYKQ